jgi:hypothetical protein
MPQTLPFLVYAARDGYGWVSGTEVPLVLRERFRRAAGKMPDFDMKGTPGLSGVVNVEEWVLVYRFMRQVGGDNRGRDCTYLAMTYFKSEVAGDKNADALLMDTAFKVPQKTPPSVIDYTGGVSAKKDWQLPEQSGSGMYDARGSLTAACAAVGGVAGGTLRISRREPDDGRGSWYDYVRNQVVEQEASSLRTEKFVSANEETTVCRSGSGCPWRTVSLLVILAFLLGVLIGGRLPS